MTVIDRRYGVAEGIAVKAPCYVATTANITLGGLQTIDGVTVSADDRVLVMAQSNTSQNGIYDVSTGNWPRAKDFDGAYDVVCGTRVFVTHGTANGGIEYKISTANPISIGTTGIGFEPLAIDGDALNELIGTVGRAMPTFENWGAVGNGITDDTAACQAAINSLTATGGGAIFLPAGKFYGLREQGGSGYCLNIPNNISLLGAGKLTCGFIPLLGVDFDVDTIRITPAADAVLQGIRLQSFFLGNIANGTRRGGYGLHIDCRANNAGVGASIFEDLYIAASGASSQAIYAESGGTTTNGCMFTSIIRNCTLVHGTQFVGLGDSNTITGCQIGGLNVGVQSALTFGASRLSIMHNSITASGGSWRHDAGSRCHYIGNNTECFGTGSSSAMINITGDSQVLPMSSIAIRDNLLLCTDPTITDVIKLAKTSGAQIENNDHRYGGADPTVVDAVDIAASCNDTLLIGGTKTTGMNTMTNLGTRTFLLGALSVSDA